MLKRGSFEILARSTAPPATVWPLIAEAARWKEWSFLTRASLLRPGQFDVDGVGALRRFAVGPFGSNEEVVAFEPPTHLGYIARKGTPVRSYRSDIVLRPDGDGTAITWTGSLEPLVPGTAALIAVFLRAFVRRFATELVRYADRLSDGS